MHFRLAQPPDPGRVAEMLGLHLPELSRSQREKIVDSVAQAHADISAYIGWSPDVSGVATETHYVCSGQRIVPLYRRLAALREIRYGDNVVPNESWVQVGTHVQLRNDLAPGMYEFEVRFLGFPERDAQLVEAAWLDIAAIRARQAYEGLVGVQEYVVGGERITLSDPSQLLDRQIPHLRRR
jgi:hypothetical protein